MEGLGNQWPDFDKQPDAEEFRKLFVGGLDKKTTKDSLIDYFVTYGEVVNCEIKNQGESTKKRGFGFITFKDCESLEEVQAKRPHFIDGQEVETKRATPKSQEYWPTKKLYFKDFNKDMEEEALKKLLKDTFSTYGNITDIKLVRDKDSKTYKGYGFIDFEDEDPVDRCNLMRKVKVGDFTIKVAKAFPKPSQYKGMGPPSNYYYPDYYMPPPWYGQPGYRDPWGWDRGGGRYPMYPGGGRYNQGGRRGGGNRKN